ncbi:MAG: hypothetical protein WCP60_04040 [bacterium]
MKRAPFLLFAVLLLTLPMLSAKNTDSPASVPVLLGLEPVRADLKLSSLQCALLDSLRSEYKKRAHQITAIGMADQDAALRANWDLQDLRRQFNSRAIDVLSPSQQDRLRQIERQMLGGTLLTSVSEQKLLGLSPQQQASLAVIEKNNQSTASAITTQFNNGKISNFSKDINLHRNQQNSSKKMLAVLTPKQKKQWEILSGQKLGLPKIHDPNANSKSLFEGY